MRSKVVTVFGGSGFIGRYVVQRLAARGAVLRVPTRRPPEALFLKPLGAIGQINLEPWNPPSPASVERLLVGADMAVNLIGILYESKGGDFDRLQARLPGEIGAAAAKAGVPRVVARVGDRGRSRLARGLRADQGCRARRRCARPSRRPLSCARASCSGPRTASSIASRG